MADRLAHRGANVFRYMRTAVRGNDAQVVDLLGLHGHESGTLYDLQIAVVARGKQGWSSARPSNTPRGQGPVLGAVEFMSLFLSRDLGESLSGFRRQGRDGSLQPHNQRRSPVPGNLGLKPVQPALGVIVMHTLRGCAFYA